MFVRTNYTLLANLAQNGTRVIPGDYDEFRMSPAGHVLMVDDNRYVSPTDFTLSSDGSGDITLTWLNALTLVTGKTLRLGIAYTDLIIGGQAGGGGGGGSADSTAALQTAGNNILTQIRDYVDTLETLTNAVKTATESMATVLASTSASPVKQAPSTPYQNNAVGNTKYLVAAGDITLTNYFIENPDAATKGYLQLFNKASTGAVTLGTTAPDMVIPLEPKQKANLAGIAIQFPLGLVIAATTTATGSTTAATAFVVNLGTRPS